MVTTGEPGSAQRRRPGRPRSRAMKATLAASAGVLLTGGMSMVPAHASAPGSGKAPAHAPAAGVEKAPTITKGKLMLAPGVVAPATTTPVSCSTQTYSPNFWGYCKGGTSTESYRAIAYCNNQEAMIGWMRTDGDVRQSISGCAAAGNGGKLNSSPDIRGFLTCSSGSGAGTFTGYFDVGSGSVSEVLQVIGELQDPGSSGSTAITDGGNYLCEFDYHGEFTQNVGTLT